MAPHAMHKGRQGGDRGDILKISCALAPSGLVWITCHVSMAPLCLRRKTSCVDPRPSPQTQMSISTKGRLINCHQCKGGTHDLKIMDTVITMSGWWWNCQPKSHMKFIGALAQQQLQALSMNKWRHQPTKQPFLLFRMPLSPVRSAKFAKQRLWYIGLAIRRPRKNSQLVCCTAHREQQI